jgi:hypothetical protein
MKRIMTFSELKKNKDFVEPDNDNVTRLLVTGGAENLIFLRLCVQ